MVPLLGAFFGRISDSQTDDILDMTWTEECFHVFMLLIFLCQRSLHTQFPVQYSCQNHLIISLVIIQSKLRDCRVSHSDQALFYTPFSVSLCTLKYYGQDFPSKPISHRAGHNSGLK